MPDKYEVPTGLGISEGRAEELRDLTLKIVQDATIVSTTDAVNALLSHIPERHELAFATVELGYALGKANSVTIAVIGMQTDPLQTINNKPKRPYAEA